MDRNSPYYKQVSLLIRVLPVVAKEDCFALKGGTAINLFVCDFPRLSIDIDLAYLPLEPRHEAISKIRLALINITKKLNEITNLSAILQDNKPDEMRIIVDTTDHENGNAQIKIEVSPVARGTLLLPSERDIVESVEDEFGFASIQVVSMPDLYGGKICAALDRQHPRDLFDIKILLKNQGIDRSIFDGFITYLLSHNRPIAEVMNPRWKDISQIYQTEFKGMTFEPITLDELNAIPKQMLQSLQDNFTQQDYDFLKSFKSGKPDWALAPSDQIQHLPAVQWKLLNIQKMSKYKHLKSSQILEDVLSSWLKA